MKNEAFELWFGQSAAESDGGWSKEVWDAAWDAAVMAAQEANEQIAEAHRQLVQLQKLHGKNTV